MPSATASGSSAVAPVTASKHGPAIGEYAAQVITGARAPEPRFSYATKSQDQGRTVKWTEAPQNRSCGAPATFPATRNVARPVSEANTPAKHAPWSEATHAPQAQTGMPAGTMGKLRSR